MIKPATNGIKSNIICRISAIKGKLHKKVVLRKLLVLGLFMIVIRTQKLTLRKLSLRKAMMLSLKMTLKLIHLKSDHYKLENMIQSF